ncbi:hypothetical protein [Bordetella bronchiseptica]|uniref:hypothetical protein n=1 Tax=Bordetella bronchiseptica TaxID=518 RepID=UPI000528A677|nr:hypothetical protein [Bordetella bronchiseptica]
MPLPVWPAGLPLVEFSRQPISPFQRTEMENGRARHRRHTRVHPVHAHVSFVLDREQYDVYQRFCSIDLNGYAGWFLMAMNGPGGLKLRKVRWLLPVPREERIPGDLWRVSGELESMSDE